jgi:nucleoside-diphosphate-sugar epimerase
MDLIKKRIAIIGGAGFLGYHLALLLKEEGAEITVIDNLMVNHIGEYAAAHALPHQNFYMRILEGRLRDLHKAQIPLRTVDAREYHQLSTALAEVNPEIIVHFAAVAHAGVSHKTPYSTFDHSLRTLENALDFAAGRDPHPLFLYQSSSMVYGSMPTPVTEESPLDPIGIYGNLKLAGERLVIAYHQAKGLPYLITRPSALYGPCCVSRRVVQTFIEAALSYQPLQVAGDGAEMLDFTYVDDWLQAMSCILKSDLQNETFNVTYGQARSLNELAEIVQLYIPHATIKYGPRDEIYPKRNTLAITKAQRMTGYNPLCPLEKGIPRYIDWYKKKGGH